VPQPDLHSAGSLAYAQYCAVCHQNNGQGAAGVFPAMAGNPTVESRDVLNLIHVILAGGQTAQVRGVHPFTMPAFASVLSDQQVADIATFVRSGWGNSGAAVSSSEVAKVRADVAKTH
jgi:mono/diheme cytochrome c family protein